MHSLKIVEWFPKTANQENQKWRELADILLQAEAYGSPPGLAYLDTSCGIHSIVQRLPKQDIWASLASHYKETYKISCMIVCSQSVFVDKPKGSTIQAPPPPRTPAVPLQVKLKGSRNTRAGHQTSVRKTQVSVDPHFCSKCWIPERRMCRYINEKKNAWEDD